MKPRWKTLVLAMVVVSIGAGSGTVRAAGSNGAACRAAGAGRRRPPRNCSRKCAHCGAAIEWMTSASTRAQLLLGRLQMQEHA